LSCHYGYKCRGFDQGVAGIYDNVEGMNEGSKQGILATRLLVRFARYLGWWIVGFLGGVLVLSFVWAQGLPEIQFWHERSGLDEYVIDLDDLSGTGIEDYLKHEDEIFDAMAALLRENEHVTRNLSLSRYNPGSRTNAANHSVNWNRTFYLDAADEKGLALTTHGLSDSPYSTRAIGQGLHTKGFDVLGLRVPGHGTMPGVLQHTSWEDFRDAYELAVDGLVGSASNTKPLVLVGYSNGAALAVDYTIRYLMGEVPHRPDLLILISPAIRVSAIASFARVQRWVSYIPGMGKLSWLDNVMEFDPYKYNSFPVTAGEEINKLTGRLRSGLDRLESIDGLASLPRIIVFQSVVDATIPPSGAIDDLLRRRPQGSGDELVLFDVNRQIEIAQFTNGREARLLDDLDNDGELPFRYTLVTNRNDRSFEAIARTREAGSKHTRVDEIGLSWPDNVFSLSHVALPFPPDDPIYGAEAASEDGLVNLATIDVRGERGVLVVSMDQLTRLRYNPFYSYMDQRIELAIRSLTVNQ
jgi:alpha-beta hydrolase superfamily lysophospholipase